MTEPERIWAWEPKSGRGMWVGNPALNGFYGTEYIRHDAAALAASPVVQDMIRQAVEAEREACAKVADDECARVLAQQDGNCAQVDLNIRMIAMLLPDLAAAIRARKGE